jgi:iron complex transport system substrate-binding protein
MTPSRSHAAVLRSPRRESSRFGALLLLVAAIVPGRLMPTAVAADAATTASLHKPRIISLAPNLTEIAYAAGAGSLLVGTVEFSDYPEAAKAVSRVGDAWRVDPERVLEMRPDVVLVWPTGTPATTISRLRSLGLNIVEVPTQSLADVPRALRQVGRLAGTLTVAEGAARDFESRVAQQRASYAQRPPLSVFIQIDDEPIYTVNGRHVISEIVALCGGRNVFADLPQLAPPISAEAVLAADPQVILSTDDTIANPLELWKQWSRMKAVRSGNVFKLSSDLVTRASPRLAQGVEVTCSALERARSRLASAPPPLQNSTR